LSQLDPKLAVLYSQLPSVLASRISFLVKKARSERFDSNRVLKFRISVRDGGATWTTRYNFKSCFKRAYEARETRTGRRDPWIADWL
jgi:hypothetical protein